MQTQILTNDTIKQAKVNLDVEGINWQEAGLLPRYDIVVLWSTTSGIGNGDPDAGNGPRIDVDDHEFATNACFKRHIRDAIPLLFPNVPGYEIFAGRGVILEQPILEAFERIGAQAEEPGVEDANGKKGKGKKARRIVDGRDIRAEVRADQCRKFWDNRAFGGMLSPSKRAEAGRIKGPLQVFDGIGIEPSQSEDICQTRTSVSDEERSKKQDGRNQDMGSRSRTRFNCFKQPMTLNPFLAKNTGFTEQDFDVAIKTMEKMFGIGESGPSATSGVRTVHKIIIFKHKSPYGNAQSYRLFESVKITKKDESPTTRFEDYDVVIEDVPKGVEVTVIDPV